LPYAAAGDFIRLLRRHRETSLRLTRETILGFLRYLGFGRSGESFETSNHPSGPAFAMNADRSKSG
jgi:hypothetical protein